MLLSKEFVHLHFHLIEFLRPNKELWLSDLSLLYDLLPLLKGSCLSLGRLQMANSEHVQGCCRLLQKETYLKELGFYVSRLRLFFLKFEVLP